MSDAAGLFNPAIGLADVQTKKGHPCDNTSWDLRFAAAGIHHTMLLRNAAEIFSADEFIEADIIFPLFNEDLQDADGIPPAVQKLFDQIAAAGRVGGARSQFSLRLAMMAFRPHILQGPEVLVGGASKEFDENGKLTGDTYIKCVSDMMDKLRAAIR
ncbi:NADPH-dependent FMN reductase [Yoonia sp.]|uniref:NADPH-dependent FMN reductase n=1 Tax=Yoonia sp. TaxID=2212373 RepID=UPI00345B9D84